MCRSVMQAKLQLSERQLDDVRLALAARIRQGLQSPGEIKALPPQKDATGNQISESGYLPWEIEEALKMKVVGDRPWGR